MNKNLLITCMCVLPACVFAAATAAGLPGITRTTNNVYLIENHSSAYNIWHSRNIRNATLVHIDAHEDCRYVTPDKLEALSRLTAERNYSEIFRQSDLEYSFRYQIKPDKALFDIGNYIYPCIMDGTISRYYWVVPEKTIDENKLVFLQEHLRAAYRIPSLTFSSMTNNSFSFILSNCTVIVTTLDSLPQQEKGTLLDIDTDFFLFPCSLTESHIRGELLWDPQKVCELLSIRIPSPSVITIAASISGGYLPVSYRFLSDGLFEYYAHSSYPADAVELLKIITAMLSFPPVDVPPHKPQDKLFLPACEHITGLTLMLKGEEHSAISRIENAARLHPAYSKAILDLADAFMSMGRLHRSHEMIDRFEKFTGGETSHSAAIRVRLLISEKRIQEADSLSRKLVDWDRSPYFLMLHAGLMAEQGRIAEATGIYQEIIKSHPDNASAYYNMGLLHANRGENDQAIENYKMAIRLKPDLSAANENLGYLLTNSGRYQEALTCLKAAISYNPFNTYSLNNLGLTYARLGMFSDAATCYNAALRLTPERSEIHANLAAALISAGKLNEGIEQCRRALKLKPDWPEVINLMNEAKKKSF